MTGEWKIVCSIITGISLVASVYYGEKSNSQPQQLQPQQLRELFQNFTEKQAYLASNKIRADKEILEQIRQKKELEKEIERLKKNEEQKVLHYKYINAGENIMVVCIGGIRGKKRRQNIQMAFGYFVAANKIYSGGEAKERYDYWRSRYHWMWKRRNQIRFPIENI